MVETSLAQKAIAIGKNPDTTVLQWRRSTF